MGSSIEVAIDYLESLSKLRGVSSQSGVSLSKIRTSRVVHSQSIKPIYTGSQGLEGSDSTAKRISGLVLNTCSVFENEVVPL